MSRSRIDVNRKFGVFSRIYQNTLKSTAIIRARKKNPQQLRATAGDWG
jgi:hypothetical protein